MTNKINIQAQPQKLVVKQKELPTIRKDGPLSLRECKDLITLLLKIFSFGTMTRIETASVTEEAKQWIFKNWLGQTDSPIWATEHVRVSEVENLVPRSFLNEYELMETVTIKDSWRNRELSIGRIGDQILARETSPVINAKWVVVCKDYNENNLKEILETAEVWPNDADVYAGHTADYLTDKYGMFVEPNACKLYLGANSDLCKKVARISDGGEHALFNYNYTDTLGPAYSCDYPRNMMAVTIKINGKELSSTVKELIYEYTTGTKIDSGVAPTNNIKTNLMKVDEITYNKIQTGLRASGLSDKEIHEMMTTLKEPSVIAGIIIGGEQGTFAYACNDIMTKVEYNAENDTFQSITHTDDILRETTIGYSGLREISVKTNVNEAGETTGATVEHIMITGGSIAGIAKHDKYGYAGHGRGTAGILRVSTITTVNN
ncbi:hypothetical protein OD632_005510, partial [Salmonella enterica]|nr:hypothetical protein [Salmonella enterica]